jgi:hypothetical protein
MNMQIHSRPFTSEAAPKAQWRLVRGAIILTMCTRSAPVIEIAPLDPAVLPLVRKVREPKLPPEPNAHVLAYVAQRKGNTPAAFIRLQCKAVGISYRMLVTKKHPRLFYEERKSIIEATVAKFPDLSSPELGRLFRRHHSAILYTLGRLSRRREQMLAYQKRLRDAKKVVG